MADDIPPPSYRPKLRLSRSWQEKTMTQRNYKSSQRIKCITPITQAMAEMKIKSIVNRRRSVANITPSVHRLFKLDPDLMKIRQQYLQRSQSQQNEDDEEEDKNNSEETKPTMEDVERNNDQTEDKTDNHINQTNDNDNENNTENDNHSLV